MLGGAPHNPAADLIARAIIAAARSYGDDPVEACLARSGLRRRCVTAAASALELERTWKLRQLEKVLRVRPSAIQSARANRKRSFDRAVTAAREVVRWALKRRAEATLVVASDLAEDRIEFDVVPWSALGVVEIPGSPAQEREALGLPAPAGEPLTITRVEGAAEVGERPDEAHPGVAVGGFSEEGATPLEGVVERPAPVVTPERRSPSPYSPARPRPAPAAPPMRPRPHVDARRKAPVGATIERRAGGVEVIRLKPITDSILKHARAQVERGLDTGECAEMFDVDVDQLEARLRAAGVML